MKTIESVIVEVINGREYSAVRVITGTIKIRQYIVFRGHRNTIHEPTLSPKRRSCWI